MSSRYPSVIRRITDSLGITRPLRSLYHKLFFSHVKREVECAGVRGIFWTPTPTIAEHVEDLGGEQEIITDFLLALRPDDVVWDVGAAFGLYSLLAAQRNPQHVVAFEPAQVVRELLERNIALNNGTAVTVVSSALGAVDSSTELYASNSPNIGTSSLVQRSDYPVKEVGAMITICRGDTLINSGALPHPTILKIDVEGAEGRVLEGLGAFLKSQTLRRLYCEVHPQLLDLHGDNTAGVEQHIRDAGLTIVARHPRGSEYHITCVREA